MQVRCVKAFGSAVPGEIVSGLPDGAAVDPDHWEIVPYEPPSLAVTVDTSAVDAQVAALAAKASALAAVTPKEGM